MCLTMVVHPAKSAISLLAVSCLIAIVIEYTYVNSVTGCMMHRFCTYIKVLCTITT